MAFKSVKQYNEERYGGLFRLVNDGDSADVIFLYRSIDDVLIADTHYIKSADYSGYVHCCGRGCPACGKNIRVQPKLFIPVYNLTENEIQFWDRSVKFENQLSKDVFEKCPNPCEYVFKVIRHGVAGDINTTYEITLIGKNSQESYDQILDRFGIKMPDYYDTICKEFGAGELSTMLSNPVTNSYTDDLPDYSVTPRAAKAAAPESNIVPDVYEPVPQDTMLPADDITAEDSEGDADIDEVNF